MAISSTEPRPARLDPQQWSNPYSVPEAVEGFKRAAATHGWSVPAGLGAPYASAEDHTDRQNRQTGQRPILMVQDVL